MFPLIKDYLEIGVKNDELIVKQTAVVQRMIANKNTGNDIDFGITEVAFAVGEPQVSREAAEAAARREVQEMEEFHLAPGVTPERREECTSVEEFLSRGEDS